MTSGNANRFQDFFEDGRYVGLKNYVYNYQLRKQAVERCLATEPIELILETGSGISPVMTRTDRIVYSDVSFLACQTLKRLHGKGWYVAADVTHLPFRPESFSHAIASEVLEHIQDDRAAVSEIACVLKPHGRFILTFPHRKAYFANDDRYVNHYRRYEIEDTARLLSEAELTPLSTQNVLGPLEKITMMAGVLCFEKLVRFAGAVQLAKPHATMNLLSPFFRLANRLYAGLLRVEALIVPQRWAAVLLTVAEKK
jgi:SAM-dependent methyltransferase